MESITVLQKVRTAAEKYKHAIVILLIGLGLMIMPGTGEQKPEPSSEVPVEQIVQKSLEQRLESLLQQIRGAGEVQVLLTERTGSETLYHSDSESDRSDTSASERITTVITEDADNAESPVVRRIDPPVYQGAVIVCQGADDPQVKLAIVEAVRCATGLGADQISVIKMK